MSAQVDDSRRVWAALSLVYVFWGSTYLGIHFVIQTMPPLLGAGIRFLVAAALLAALLATRGGLRALRVPLRGVGAAAAVGILLLTGGNGLVSVGVGHISTGLAALLVASVPLWLAVFRRVTGDRPAMPTVAGVLIGFCGLSLLTVTRGGASADPLSVAEVLFAALCWATGSFLSARLPMPDSPFVASVYEMTAGGLALLILASGRGESVRLGAVSAVSWIALAYLVVFGSLVAFTSYVWLLGNAPISLTGTYAYVNPAVAVLLGVVFASEHVTWLILLGGLTITVGVGLVVSTEGRTRPEP
jgi:drug/metabolite transporter (DMT)-like permease